MRWKLGPGCCGATHSLKVNPTHSLHLRSWSSPVHQWGYAGSGEVGEGERFEEKPTPTPPGFLGHRV